MCYAENMRRLVGHVHQGHIEVSETLPEGMLVAVSLPGEEEMVELGEEQLRELDLSLAQAERGEVRPWSEVLSKLFSSA